MTRVHFSQMALKRRIIYFTVFIYAFKYVKALLESLKCPPSEKMPAT